MTMKRNDVDVKSFGTELKPNVLQTGNGFPLYFLQVLPVS
jgi:hypothetical protein